MMMRRMKSLVVTSLLLTVSVFPVFMAQVEARGVAVEGPRGNEAVAVQGPRGNVAVGARVNTLPDSAREVEVGGKRYYVDGDVYYAADDSNGEVVYVVVPAPE